MKDFKLELTTCPDCGSLPRQVTFQFQGVETKPGERNKLVTTAAEVREITLCCTNFHFWRRGTQPQKLKP